MRVSVIGGGAGGRAVAADFAGRGDEVTLFEFPRFAATLGALQAEPVIRVVENGELRAAPLARVTTDADAAFADADLIVPVVPAFGHAMVAAALTPHLREQQTVCFLGEGSGTLSLVRAMGEDVSVTLAEANTLPYLARLGPDGQVLVRRKTGGFVVAALPSSRTESVIALLKPTYPFVRAGENVLETVLLNFNAIDHVSPMVLNAGTLQAPDGPFRLWGTGGTPAVVRAIDAVDQEILALRTSLGFADRRPYRDFLYEQGILGERTPTTYEAIHASALADVEVTRGAEALQVRFLTEDVPCALTLIASIGDTLEVPTPTIDALITLAGVLLAEDYWSTGRTLHSLGLPTDRAGLLRLVGAGAATA